MLEYILPLLCLPPLCAVLALAGRFANQTLHWLHRLTATAVGVTVLLLAANFNPSQPYADDYFYIDALSCWVLLIITTLYVAASWMARSYLTREERCGVLKGEQLQTGRYFALMQLFCWTMFIVLLVKNLGLMWVAIEATTLISALLISFKFTRAALEATWKYIMVCTVGICLALLGTLVLYYAQLDALGSEKALSWLYLYQNASALDPAMTRLALLFIVIGYGTKAGMAPMHTWLPDAYAEAPSLTSGMLSGALCSCAIYVLLRNLVILLPTAGSAMMSGMLLFFAVLTVAVAVPFVVVQRDIKRLLAYSSMENIGIMVAGIGAFSAFSLKAVMLHMYSHAMIKFVLFYIAGTVIQEYQTRNMMRIHGMIKDVPYTATFWLTGMLGILGLPPMGLFFSKFYIMAALFREGHWLAGSLLIVLLAGVLIGILYHGMRMLGDSARRKPLGELLGSMDIAVLALLLLATCAVGAGFEAIPWLDNVLNCAVRVIGG
ncbi:MAG: proton-conducting transporter membrane subunit [Phascolarctobacterium sp.]|uniref:proton-conducting transporter transmembrane domain-containing protein n=1 Tax=Phascolarctobacterium sp. TaxID=2049039 RepID=UPI0026DC5F5F|nr:proton-conducting transporter membrane subunit [Phascolarctobacterium sp.]MDO4921995.1 proton-conducting transporter membrane subunit [Phascolarctobacterium sp.]